jgi:hypothetical protein
MSAVGILGRGAVIAQAGARTYFEFSRLQTMDQWWQWPLFVLATALLIVFVVALYRRDTRDLSRPVRWLLTILRLAAFAGLFVFFLGLEKRTEHRIVKNSRTIVGIDTSQSMGLVDTDPTSNPRGLSRAERVAESIEEGGLIDQLRTKHDVVVYRFDEGDQPIEIASLPRTIPNAPVTDDPAESKNSPQEILAETWRMATVSGVLLGIGLLALAIHWFVPGLLRGRDGESWALLVGVLALGSALVVFGVSNLRHPEVKLAHLVGARSLSSTTDRDEDLATDRGTDAEDSIDWRDTLRPSGVSTKLGDALQFLVDHERGGPIAGICLLSDGNANAGTDWREALQSAQDAEVPVFTIGVGTDRPPINVRVVDIEAPARVYPGDAFHLTAFLQSYGLEGQSVRMELVASQPAPAGDEAPPVETFIEERRVQLGSDGAVLPIDFELHPEETGRVRYKVRVKAPAGDLDARDNQQVADVRIIDRKNKVLLFAGGATREYRFLRVLCYRDREIEVDVHIQGVSPEMAQEADRVLAEFPTTVEEMFQYDCVVAFDPDWMILSDAQIELLERWVAEKAGGLILIAGPVYTPEWTTLGRGSAADETLRALYPVIFYRRGGSRLGRGRFASTQAWPLEMTDEGLGARFLWLDDSPARSLEIWSRFEGVYGYQPVRGAKPASNVYARFSNPDTEVDGELPVFMAGQFYGAGRVFYLGSGEMWRLNAMDVGYFERFYTQLMRSVSQGRLLRDSSRGILLVSKDRCILGETIVVRAGLSDAQFRPLTRQRVAATLVSPDGIRRELVLRKIQESGQEGTYSGQFPALSEGDYRVELAIPDSPDLELLDKTVRVRLPDREVESPQRNDAVLSELAESSGGEYFVGLAAALGSDGAPSESGLMAAITPQDQETYFPGAPDKDFQQRLMAWLLVLICGALVTEWLVRRLSRLA